MKIEINTCFDELFLDFQTNKQALNDEKINKNKTEILTSKFSFSS